MLHYVFFSGLSRSVEGIGPSLTLFRTLHADCGTCVGHQQLYECTTVGIGTTVWKGTAFQCPGSSILLSHSLFSSGTTDSCNNGAIVGHSVRAVSNCYTSQLNVTVDASMNGQTIKCIYNNGSTEREIGRNTIVIREGAIVILFVMNTCT